MSQSKVTTYFRTKKHSSVNIAGKKSTLDTNLKASFTPKNSDAVLCSFEKRIVAAKKIHNEKPNLVAETTPSTKTSVENVSHKGPTKGTKRKLPFENESPTSTNDVTPHRSIASARKRLLLDKMEMQDPLKAKLIQAGKLDEVKSRLNKIREATAKLKQVENNRLTSSTSAIDAEETRVRTPPAYERFSNLISSESLPLPRKYKELNEAFHCTDAAVSMMHNKKEPVIFNNLKCNVEKLMNRPYTQQILSQIKTVFPNAYFYQQKNLCSSISKNKSQYHLVLIPNSDYKTAASDVNVSGNLCDYTTFQEMTTEMLLERRKIFSDNLLNIAKKHHEAFLASLKPPIKIPSNLLYRWHPHFPVDDVPEVKASSLPEPPESKEYSTAADVLDKIRGKGNNKVENALKQVAEKHKTSSPQSANSVDVNKILKGVSKSLLEKIRARKAEKLAKEMICPPEEKHNAQMMSRLPEMVTILRAYFIAERRTAIRVEDAVKNIRENFHTPISTADAERHIDLMVMFFPDWISVIKLPRGMFLKINKDVVIEDLTKRVNGVIKGKL